MTIDWVRPEGLALFLATTNEFDKRESTEADLQQRAGAKRTAESN